MKEVGFLASVMAAILLIIVKLLCCLLNQDPKINLVKIVQYTHSNVHPTPNGIPPVIA